MKIAVTGVTGYVGKCFAKWAISEGHKVVALSRSCPGSVVCDWIPYELSSKQPPILPIDTDAVLHLATSKSSNDQGDDAQEVLAAELLIKAAQEVSAKFIFVSSQTARPDAPTAYGRIKWRIEQEVLSAGGWVIRPGQVYGGMPRGLFGELVKMVRHLPVLPAFMPTPKVQPIHVNDLVAGLLRIAERENAPPGVYCLAAPEPVSFSKFLDEIAKSRLRCWRGFVPVPVVVINGLAIILGESLQTRLGLERLRSLFDLPVMETASDLKQLGLTLRPLRSGMHPSGNDRRRCLLQEGWALLTYVLKEPPSSALLRRYVRAIEHLRDDRAIGLPKFFLSYPIYLSLLDKSEWADKTVEIEFSWRLDAATVLAEATPSGAYRFLGLGRKHGMLSGLLSMMSAVASEVFWRMLSVLLFPLVRLILGRAKGAL